MCSRKLDIIICTLRRKKSNLSFDDVSKQIKDIELVKIKKNFSDRKDTFNRTNTHQRKLNTAKMKINELEDTIKTAQERREKTENKSKASVNCGPISSALFY